MKLKRILEIPNRLMRMRLILFISISYKGLIGSAMLIDLEATVVTTL